MKYKLMEALRTSGSRRLEQIWKEKKQKQHERSVAKQKAEFRPMKHE